jgi:hypothetical protein
VFLVAIATINGPAAVGLEGNLTRLSALCTGRIVHLSWAAAKASSAASISFHLISLTFYRLKESIYATKTSQQKFFESTQCSSFLKATLAYISVGQNAFGV